MTELKIYLLAENVTEKQLDRLDKFLMEEFNTQDIVITTSPYEGGEDE